MIRAHELESRQRKIYNQIILEYMAHNSDKWGQEYRRRFWYQDLFEGMELKGKQVLEPMCGYGQATAFLVSLEAKVTGLDISDLAITLFKKRWPNSRAVRTSILNSKLKSNFYDCIVSIAGLHHLHPHLHQAIEEIYRLLKPGGTFCFVEPHRGSWPDLLRKLWYKYDRLFLSNETSIDLNEIKKINSRRFLFKKEKYGGNFAYIFVANSVVFRKLKIFKPVYAPILIPLEDVLGRLQGRLTSCYVLCQWQKIANGCVLH